ncbi:MAG: right-handed parallel beta-helix repeat-containing protein, partial [Planctomycetota bacterium]
MLQARSLVPFSLAALLLPAVAAAQVLHVDVSLTTGADDGTSWANAYQGSEGLHAALASAPDGAEIWLTSGTYKPSATGDKTRAFLVEGTRIVLRGGFAGTESNVLERPPRGTAPTVLSGDLAGNDGIAMVSPADNSPVVLDVDGTFATFENLTVSGGGLLAPGTLGAIDVQSSNIVTPHTVRFEHVVVERGYGRGVGSIASNMPGAGVGLAFSDCTFRDLVNSAVFMDSVEGCRVDRCVFQRCGNGLEFRWSWGITRIRDTVIQDCSGVGICLCWEFFFEVPPSVVIQGCTIAGNGGTAVLQTDAGSGPLGPFDILLRNSIVWGNAFGLFGEVDAEHSIVQGGAGSGPGVLGVDPLFVDFNGGDLRLTPGSPAVDRGAEADVELDGLDVVRRHRVVDIAGVPNGGPSERNAVDLGAIEFTGAIGHNGDCGAEVNSTGRPGRISARGSSDALSNDFALIAELLPPQQFGMFITSRSLGQVPMAGGLGTLCLGGQIGRFNGPGQIQLSSAAGTIALGVDLTQVPQPSAR